MIFDGVVSTTDQVLSDVGPFVPHDKVREVKEPLFLISPFLLLDVRVQVVVPPFTALLANTTCMIIELPGRFSAMVVHF